MKYLPAEEGRAYEDDMERLKKRDNLTYLMDGWEDSMKRSLYGCLLSEVGEFPIVLALKELTGIRATADNLVTVADEALRQKAVKAWSIIAVCTDNPTMMQSFCQKWTTEGCYPWILPLLCFIHGVNTILGKVSSYASVKSLIKKNTKIVTFFNASHYWGENNITHGLKKNTESRFYAIILQALSAQEHKKVLYELCSHDEAQRTIGGLSPIWCDVISCVLELGQWQLNKEFICICKPLVDLIGDTESWDVTLADCIIQLIWAHCKINNLPESEFEDKQFLRHAKETITHYFHTMNTELHWLSLFLHPLCQKLALLSSVHSRTLKDAFNIALTIAEKWEWSRAHAEQLLRDIQAYASEESPFTGGKADVKSWWTSVNIGFHPIWTFSLKIMAIVPHAAEVEHFFSNLGGVQSVKRSRLTVDHLGSLGMLHNFYN
ncbi:ribonuclease H-like domain-containing protein [Cyathus striatus]|nr:ribonuclease H-like domain-containing protein [Cyathus striatus]